MLRNDTGDETMTGGRLKRVGRYIEKDDVFCFTYGDGVSDVPINQLVANHKLSRKKVTVTAIQPPGRKASATLRGPISSSTQCHDCAAATSAK